MKKTIKKVIWLLLIISIIICVAYKLRILDFFVPSTPTEQEQEKFSGLYYYNQLNDSEKQIYLSIDRSVANLQKNVNIGFEEKDTNSIKKTIEAYYNDNPELFFLGYDYLISVTDLLVEKLTVLKLNFLFEDKEEINKYSEELNQRVKLILKESIDDSMTDIEKEIAIHDYLVQNVKYYSFENIEDIPNIKHTAYGAIVGKEAVCDGISKAFAILMRAANIECMPVSGTLDGAAHEWCLVKLNGEYYHIDVTSDMLEEKNAKEIAHIYFNITDKELESNHIMDKTFGIPKCTSTKYNYYRYKGLYLAYSGSLTNRLEKMISQEKNKSLFEVKVDEGYTKQVIIDTLYNLNFNNWSTSNMVKITYHKVNDVYLFTK